MKSLIFCAAAIVVVIAVAVNKDEAVEEFQGRCLLMAAAFGKLTSMFGSNNQQVYYPPVQEPIYSYYPIYDNQEIIYEWVTVPDDQYFYYYPSVEYVTYVEQPYGNGQPIYYYDQLGSDGYMRKTEISENTYREYQRRNKVIRTRNIERGVLPAEPTKEQLMYDPKYEEYPRPAETQVVQRPVQKEQVIVQRPVQETSYRPVYETETTYRPVYETEVVQQRPVQKEQVIVQRPVQETSYRPAYETEVVQQRPVQVVYRPAPQPQRIAVVAVEQKKSPLQSLFGLSSRNSQSQPILISGQQAKNLQSRN